MILTTAVTHFLQLKSSSTKRRRPAAQGTLLSYKAHLSGFIKWVMLNHHGREGVNLFTAELAARYIDWRHGKNLSPHTLSLDSVALREFATWGAKVRLWPREIVDEIPQVLKPQTLPRPYDEAERERIMALVLPLEDQVLRGLLYYCGLRRAEIVGLRINDITLPHAQSDGTVFLGKIHVLGKGGKRRMVSIYDGFWPVLKAYLETRTSDRVDSPLLVRDGAHWGEQMIPRRVLAWGKAANVDKPKAHRFRHSFATRVYEATSDLRLVQDMLGHSSPSTTAIYTKVVDRRRDAGVSAAFGGSQTSRQDSQTLGVGEGPQVANPHERKGEP